MILVGGEQEWQTCWSDAATPPGATNPALGTPISAHEVQDVFDGQKQHPDEHHRARCFERNHGFLEDDTL